MTKLFVIGSLSEGRLHFDIVKEFVLRKTKAQVQGEALILDCGYPDLIESSDSYVWGEIFEIENGEILLRLMDEFFGYSIQNIDKSLHWRKKTKALLEDGTEEDVFVYYMNPQKVSKSAKRLSGACWKSYMQENEPIVDQLSERERTYITKLGAAVGRDIVPIQMDLYRQLTHSGVIVDKGRRLALTKLGKEIYRYLSLESRN